MDFLKALKSRAVEEDFPEMAAAVATRQIREPERMKGVTVKPMSAIGKLLSRLGAPGGAQAAFSPITNTLTYDKAEILKGGIPLQTLLEHELTHADQRRRRGFFGSLMELVKQHESPHGERPDEREAYDREGQTHLKYRTGDVRLR